MRDERETTVEHSNETKVRLIGDSVLASWKPVMHNAHLHKIVVITGSAVLLAHLLERLAFPVEKAKARPPVQAWNP